MTRYRKKPVVIEAWQWQGRLEDLPDWIQSSENVAIDPENSDVIIIKTVEGVLTVPKGCWIIRGAKDELYPCAPDAFERTYERADGSDGGE